MAAIEPWLRGTIQELHPVQAAVLHSYQQASEELRAWTARLSDEEMWQRPHGLAPVGFQVRHIGGSVERLTTYLRGEQLSEAQLAATKNELEPGAGREELLAAMEQSFAASEAVVRTMGPERFGEPRPVGRKQLPTTVGGLLVHLAEHTQRHVGQAIVTIKVVRGARVTRT